MLWGSCHGKGDPRCFHLAVIYRFTLGLPSKDHRIYYSALLAIIAINIVSNPRSYSWQIFSLKLVTIYQVVATYIAQAFNEPEVVLRTKKQK